MAANMDYQSCRYSSWCPDRYDADEWYEAMDQQYAIDTASSCSGLSTTAAPSSYYANCGGGPTSTMRTSRHNNYYDPASTTTTSSSGRTSMMMPLTANTMMTVCEDQPPFASAAAAASVPRVFMPAVPMTKGDTTSSAEAGDTIGRANVATRMMMMMMMPSAAADEEAAKLSSPFDWRELEASCRKLDEANIRITELDITCLGSPTTSDSAFDADANGVFGSSGDSDSGGGGGSCRGGNRYRSHVQVRYGITCEPADTSSVSARPAINGGNGAATIGDIGMMACQTHASQPRHPTHVYGFPPVHHKLPPAAVHHMPLPSSVHVRRAQEVNTVNDRRHIHVHSAATSSSKGGSDRSRGNAATNASSGHGSFARPRSASTIAALSSILGGSGTRLEGGGGSGAFSLQPSSGFGTTGSGSDSDPVSGWRFGLSPARGAQTTSIVVPPGNDDSVDLAVLPESGSSEKAASSDSSDSVPVSCGSSSNSSSNATDTNSTADVVDEAGMENRDNTKTAGTGKPSVHETSPDPNSKVSNSRYSSTQGPGNTTNGKSFSRVMRAFADRCQRAFTITPGRGRALRMTAAVQHRRCNSNERLDQLHIAMK